MELTWKNMSLRAGDQLKIQGKIHNEAVRFRIDLGSGEDELAFHFNPRFNDGKPVLVCNSMHDGSWGEEQIQPNPFQKGASVKVVVKHTGCLFEVELPDGQEIKFPNREGLDVISYIRVNGDFALTSLKMC